MAAKSGVVGGIYKQSSTTDTFTDEAATMQADNKTLIIDDLLFQGFVRNIALFTIENDSGAIDPIESPFEINFDRIIFLEEQSPDTNWLISGTYAELEQIGGAYEWSLDMKHSVQDVTAWPSKWEEKIKSVLGWTAGAKRHYIDDDYISIAEAGLPVIIRLFTDIDEFDSYVGYGQIEGIKPADKVEGVTDGEITFSGDGHLIWCTDELVNIA